MGLCPFHSERTPSFSVNPQKNIFKCFGCGVGGDQIYLYALMQGIDNSQAVTQLAKRLGLSRKRKLTPKQRFIESKCQEDKHLESSFFEECQKLFYTLCDIRKFMKAQIDQYQRNLEDDPFVVLYYHKKAYHEYLLDGLLAGYQKQLDIEMYIDYFFAAEKEVGIWINLFDQ